MPMHDTEIEALARRAFPSVTRIIILDASNPGGTLFHDADARALQQDRVAVLEQYFPGVQELAQARGLNLADLIWERTVWPVEKAKQVLGTSHSTLLIASCVRWLPMMHSSIRSPACHGGVCDRDLPPAYARQCRRACRDAVCLDLRKPAAQHRHQSAAHLDSVDLWQLYNRTVDQGKAGKLLIRSIVPEHASNHITRAGAEGNQPQGFLLPALAVPPRASRLTRRPAAQRS